MRGNQDFRTGMIDLLDGLDGVQEQVDQHLSDLHSVRLHPWKIGVGPKKNGDAVFPSFETSKLQRLHSDFVQVVKDEDPRTPSPNQPDREWGSTYGNWPLKRADSGDRMYDGDPALEGKTEVHLFVIEFVDRESLKDRARKGECRRSRRPTPGDKRPTVWLMPAVAESSTPMSRRPISWSLATM